MDEAQEVPEREGFGQKEPKRKRKKFSLAGQILIAMLPAIAAGLLLQSHADMAENIIAPFGTIFLNPIRFIIAPIVLFSIIAGALSLGHPQDRHDRRNDPGLLPLHDSPGNDNRPVTCRRGVWRRRRGSRTVLGLHRSASVSDILHKRNLLPPVPGVKISLSEMRRSYQVCPMSTIW